MNQAGRGLNLMMGKLLKPSAKGQRGFTLIELLAVISIIGILAGLVAGTVSGIGETGQSARLSGDENTIGKAADRFFTDAFPPEYPVIGLDATDDSLNPEFDSRLSQDLGVRLVDFDATLPQDAAKSFVPDFLKDVPETAGLVSWRIDTNTGNAFFAEDGAFLARPSSARLDVRAGSTRIGALKSTLTEELSDYTFKLVMKKGDAAMEQIEMAIPAGYIIGGQALTENDVIGNLSISFGPDNSWDSGETIDVVDVDLTIVATNEWQAVVDYDDNISTGISNDVEIMEGSAVEQQSSATPIADIRTHTISVTPPVGESPGKLVITFDRSNEDSDGKVIYTDSDANEATITFTMEIFGTVNSTTVIKNPATKGVFRWLPRQATAIDVVGSFRRLSGNQAIVVKSDTTDQVNEAPVAGSPAASTSLITEVTVAMAATDANIDDVLTFSITSLPVNNESVDVGTLRDGVTGNLITSVPFVLSNGTVKYTASTAFANLISGDGTPRIETFGFSVSDGELSDNGTATVTVGDSANPVNDTPVAIADNYAFFGQNTLNVPPAAPGVLDNDIDVNSTGTLTAILVTGPTNDNVGVRAFPGTGIGGAPFVLNEDGSFDYTSLDGVTSDSFSYKTFDGSEFSNIVTVTLIAE